MDGSIPILDPKVVRDRFVALGQQFTILRDTLASQVDKIEMEMDTAKLHLVVTAYFHDVRRYKAWHYGDPDKGLLDGTKKAAFMCYWLTKLSPISTRRAPGNPPEVDAEGMPLDPSVCANAYFALFVAMSYLNLEVSDEMYLKLLYHMLWRDESARSYMLLFETFRMAASGTPVVVKNQL